MNAMNDGLQKPGPIVTRVMIGLFAIWISFAIGINWAGASEDVFLLFCGNTDRILSGEVWRLFTAPLMHVVSGGISHILFALVGLFFLTPSLETEWGPRRLVRFLIASSLCAYGLQMLAELALPAGIAARLVPPYWFGFFPVIDAIAIAWASSFRGRVIRLFMVLPLSSRGLILTVIGFNVLAVIAAGQAPGGLLAPFGGMLAGWAFGGSTPSPARRWMLRMRLARLDREAARARTARKDRVTKGPLRVIEGGKAEDDDAPRGPDGRWLN